MQRFVQFYLSWKFCCAAAQQVDRELARLGVWGGGGGGGGGVEGGEKREEEKEKILCFPSHLHTPQASKFHHKRLFILFLELRILLN